MARRAPRTETPAPPGPGRWAFKQYQIHEKMTPVGRRYEIRGPNRALVAVCRVKKIQDEIPFYATDEEADELFRLKPKEVKQFAAAFSVVDAPSGRTIGEFRKKVYKPVNKSEWLIYGAEGSPAGMVTASAPPTNPLTRILPFIRMRSYAYQLHWGQSIGGLITGRPTWPMGGDHTTVDLVLDKKDEVDRRLAISVAVLVRDDERNGLVKA